MKDENVAKLNNLIFTKIMGLGTKSTRLSIGKEAQTQQDETFACSITIIYLV
jgi:hypothetical protein